MQYPRRKDSVDHFPDSYWLGLAEDTIDAILLDVEAEVQAEIHQEDAQRAKAAGKEDE